MAKFQQTLEESKANIRKIRFLPHMPFYGRENHVRIAELAKAGLRYLGDSRSGYDTFLVETYGLVDVQPIELEYSSGNKETVWVGKAVTEKGRKELTRLVEDKLPWIEKDDLPAEFKRMYVMTKSQTIKEKARRGKKELADLKKRGESMAKGLSVGDLRMYRARAESELKYEKNPSLRKRKELEIEIIDRELGKRKSKPVMKRRSRVKRGKTSVGVSSSK